MLNWRERLSNLGWLYLSVYWVYLVVFIQINNIFIFFNRLHGNTYPKQILVGILAPYFILEISLAVTMWRAELKMALHQPRTCSFRYLMHTLLQHLCTGLGWQKSTPAQQTWAHVLQMETVANRRSWFTPIMSLVLLLTASAWSRQMQRKRLTGKGNSNKDPALIMTILFLHGLQPALHQVYT